MTTQERNPSIELGLINDIEFLIFRCPIEWSGVQIQDYLNRLTKALNLNNGFGKVPMTAIPYTESEPSSC